MPATQLELQKIARMKIVLRRSPDQIAAEVGVSPATVAKWTKTPEYAAAVEELRRECKEAARSRVAALSESVLATLEDLMLCSKQDKIRFESARTLGEWLGLHEADVGGKGDDRGDLVDILRRMADRPEAQIVLAPPLPGGILPGAPTAVPLLDAPREVITITEKGERAEEGGGEGGG